MKPATHEVLTGICSCCLGRFVVGADQKPVLHGYKRPGDGSIYGDCNGMRFPMYEIRPEGCAWMRDGLLRGAAALREEARQLRAGETKEVVKYIKDRRTRETTNLVLTPESSKEDFHKINCWNWEELIDREASAHERLAASNEATAATFQQYIDAWKPGLEFKSEARLDAEKQEVRDQKAAAARKKRNFKAMKAIFFHLGSAINKHRKGWNHAEWEWEQNLIKWDAERAAKNYANVKRLDPFEVMYPQYAKKGKK